MLPASILPQASKDFSSRRTDESTQRHTGRSAVSTTAQQQRPQTALWSSPDHSAVMGLISPWQEGGLTGRSYHSGTTASNNHLSLKSCGLYKGWGGGASTPQWWSKMDNLEYLESLLTRTSEGLVTLQCRKKERNPAKLYLCVLKCIKTFGLNL